MLQTVNQNYGLSQSMLGQSLYGTNAPTAAAWGGGGWPVSAPTQSFPTQAFAMGGLQRQPASLMDKIIGVVVDGIAKIVSNIINTVIQSFVPQIVSMVQGLFGTPAVTQAAGSTTPTATPETGGEQAAPSQDLTTSLLFGTDFADTIEKVSSLYETIKGGYEMVSGFFGKVGSGFGKAVNFIKNIF